MQKHLWVAIIAFLPLLIACRSATASPTQGYPDDGPGGQSPAESVQILKSVDFEVRQYFTITNHGPGEASKHNLWVALVGDIPPYQEVRSLEITPENYQAVTDEYGNQIAEFDLAGMQPGDVTRIEIEYRVKINQLSYDLSECQGELPTFFTQPELHIESYNPQIRSLSAELARGTDSACETVRAFYDYIGNNLVYSYNRRNWGAQAALGEMGADCSEYASLMIALSRAAGIPARYLEGIIYLTEEAGELARTEHAWLEVYLPGIGWTPMDPTLGRSSIFREDYFAAVTPDHIIVTTGRNPSTLRGSSYWTHIYWPGDSTVIKIDDFDWQITPAE
jgi:transglutaminase-like putative cysteine protease